MLDKAVRYLEFYRNKYFIGIAMSNVLIAGFLLMDKKYVAGMEILKKTFSI